MLAARGSPFTEASNESPTQQISPPSNRKFIIVYKGPNASPYSKQRTQSTPSAPHDTFQYYYPICAYVIPIRITIVTIITITQEFLVPTHFKTICSELCFSSDRAHIPLRISLLSPLNFPNSNRNHAVPLLQQDTPTLFLSPFLLHFPGRNPPLTQHDQTPNFATLYLTSPALSTTWPLCWGQDKIGGIPTRYGLDGPGFEPR